jgi:hypothetical protein
MTLSICFWGQNMAFLNLKNMILTHIKKYFCEKKAPISLDLKNNNLSRQISTTGSSRAAKI